VLASWGRTPAGPKLVAAGVGAAANSCRPIVLHARKSRSLS